MTYYFIENRPNEHSGPHVLHRVECQILPDADFLYPIGMHAHVSSAIEKGSGIVSTIEPCPACCAKVKNR